MTAGAVNKLMCNLVRHVVPRDRVRGNAERLWLDGVKEHKDVPNQMGTATALPLASCQEVREVSLP